MSSPNKKIEKPPSPEYRTFTEALSLAILVSKPELQKRLDEKKGEKVSRIRDTSTSPQSPSLRDWEAPCRSVLQRSISCPKFAILPAQNDPHPSTDYPSWSDC